MFSFQLCAEGPDGEIYCNLCYAYKHGHKAKPNLNVADVTAIQGQDGEANVCPRYNESRRYHGLCCYQPLIVITFTSDY